MLRADRAPTDHASLTDRLNDVAQAEREYLELDPKSANLLSASVLVRF